MLEQLFSSKTRVKLLRLFINNPNNLYYVRELTRLIDSQINAVRRELDNLVRLGFLVIKDKESIAADLERLNKANILEKDKHEHDSQSKLDKVSNTQKKYYQVDKNFILLAELKSLLFKSDLLVEKDFVAKLKQISDPKYLLLSGVFVGDRSSNIDLLLVGQINQQKFNKLVETYEKSLSREINYTIMQKDEFIYRRSITDKFLFSIFEQKHVVVIDNLEKI